MVQINKDQLVQMLREKGQANQADQAQLQLPEQVDTDQHASLLSDLNIDPQKLLGDLGGDLHL